MRGKWRNSRIRPRRGTSRLYARFVMTRLFKRADAPPKQVRRHALHEPAYQRGNVIHQKGQQPGQSPPSSDELLRLIIESATDYAIIALDRQGGITSWNVGAERLTGFAGDEIIGADGDVLFMPEDRAAGAPESERAIARARGRASDERWHLRKDGSRFW